MIAYESSNCYKERWADPSIIPNRIKVGPVFNLQHWQNRNSQTANKIKTGYNISVIMEDPGSGTKNFNNNKNE